MAPIEFKATVTAEMYLRFYRWHVRKNKKNYIGTYSALALNVVLWVAILVWEIENRSDALFTALLGLLLGFVIGSFAALCVIFIPLPRVALRMGRKNLGRAKTYGFYPDFMDIWEAEPGGCTILRFSYTAVADIHKAEDAYYFSLEGHRQYKAIIVPEEPLEPERIDQVIQWINAARGI